MEHVPRIPASRRLDPLPKETCAEFVDLTYVFGSIPELLPNILVSTMSFKGAEGILIYSQ